MYNRYIPSGTGYTRVTMDGESGRGGQQSVREQAAQRKGDIHRPGAEQGSHPPRSGQLSGIEDKNAGIAGILKAFKLDDVDSGDVLLLLIILLLFLEGDNIELVITLGLMLLLGLGEEKEKDTQKE